MANDTVNKIIFGNTVLADLTRVTATADKVLYGTTFHDMAGVAITGSYIESSGASVTGNNLTIDNSFSVPSWGSGSDADIATALDLHYRNIINLSDYWKVGDTRTVTLSSIPAQSPLIDTHVSQNVTMVLLNVGGKELVEPINGKTECAFIVGQLNCLQDGGAFHHEYDRSICWDNSDIRKWCNDNYYNAIPSTLRGIFKKHKNATANGVYSDTVIISEDYFSFASEKEISNTTHYASSVAEQSLSQFDFYKENRMKIKKNGDNGNACDYVTRSPAYAFSKGYIITIRYNGVEHYYIEPQITTYLAPFGVI